MRKGYTDGRPWHGNQVRAGPVLICGYSESGCDVVIQVAHVHIGVGAEWRRSGSGRGQMEVECGRGLPRGADKEVTRGKRARGRSYHDNWQTLKKELKSLYTSSEEERTYQPKDMQHFSTMKRKITWLVHFNNF